jgi:hypothetical protein
MRIRYVAPFLTAWALAAATIALASSCGSGVMCRSTKPDIAVIALEKFQDPHTMSAENWRSLYCLEWRDQCTHCQRKTLTSKIACEALPGVDDVCKGDYTLCLKANSKVFDKFCAGQDTGMNVEVHNGDADQGARRAKLFQGGGHWLHWEKVKSHWELSDEDALLGSKGPNRRDDIVDRYTGFECRGTYSKEDLLKLR